MKVCTLFACSKATSQLSQALKAEAATVSDPASQTKLLTAAKLLADATAHMVEAAKVDTVILFVGNILTFFHTNNVLCN